MTKRFTETISTGIVTDNKTGTKYTCEMRIDDNLLNLINTISDENEQLKHHIKKLQNRNLVQTANISCDKLEKENEELKQKEEKLLCEIDDFQELLAKKDSVCHKRVIDLIDDRISNFSNVRAELLLNSDDDYRLEKLSFAIQNLRELKKELEE